MTWICSLRNPTSDQAEKSRIPGSKWAEAPEASPQRPRELSLRYQSGSQNLRILRLNSYFNMHWDHLDPASGRFPKPESPTKNPENPIKSPAQIYRTFYVGMQGKCVGRHRLIRKMTSRKRIRTNSIQEKNGGVPLTGDYGLLLDCQSELSLMKNRQEMASFPAQSFLSGASVI